MLHKMAAVARCEEAGCEGGLGCGSTGVLPDLSPTSVCCCIGCTTTMLLFTGTNAGCHGDEIIEREEDGRNTGPAGRQEN